MSECTQQYAKKNDFVLQQVLMHSNSEAKAMHLLQYDIMLN